MPVTAKRGMVLVVVLLLSIVMAIMGMAFIGSRALLYQESSRIGEQALAKAFAESGLEDARVKLDKDPDFPPPGREEQNSFSYSEDMSDLSGNFLGYYEVTIDTTYAVEPYSILRITSVGRVGPRDKPRGQHVLRAELDIAQTDRSDPNLLNPRNFVFSRWSSSQNP